MNRVLIVDDVQDNITLLTYDLEDDGFEVLAARTGEQCLAMAQSANHRPDIILLDIHMPGISGITTLQELKAQPSTSDIPVIMVSANNNDNTIIDSIDLGAHDFVTKPIDYPILAARMRSALRLFKALVDLEKANRELNKLATKDPLTDSYNRRYFFTLSAREAAKTLRHQRDLAVMMLDIDHFKKINDEHSHACGDQALVSLAECLAKVCRDTDILGRIGGEEFALCCPDTGLEGARALAERLRAASEALVISCDGLLVKMTVSIGVTLLHHKETFDQALHRADELLYQAKHEGRNRVVLRGAEAPQESN